MGADQDTANGQDKQVRLDREAKQLKLEQTKAEARQAIAEAQQATLAAQLPASDTKPLEGSVAVGENVGLVADLVAHALIDDAAKEIVDEIGANLDAKATVLLVENRELAASDWPYWIIRGEISRLRKRLDDQKSALTGAMPAPPPSAPAPQEEFVPVAGAALTAGAAAISSVASIVGMFRTDYSVTARAVTIGKTPLLSALSHHLLAATKAVTVDGFTVIDSQLVGDFAAAAELRLELEGLRSALSDQVLQPAERRIEDRRAELKDAAAAYTKALGGAAPDDAQPSAKAVTEATEPQQGAPASTAHEDLVKRVTDLRAELDAAETAAGSPRALVATTDDLLTRFDAFATVVTAPPATGGLPPLVAAGLREPIHGDTPMQTHVLYVDVESSGGETVTKRSLFAPSGRVAFIGGAVVSYLLWDAKQRRLVAAGTKTLLGRLDYKLSSAFASASAGPIQRIPLESDGEPTVELMSSTNETREAGNAAGATVGDTPPSPFAAEEAIEIDPDYAGRPGYDPEFLGAGKRSVPLPILPDNLIAKASINRLATSEPRYLLPYHHFSVVLNKERRLAFFTAVNIDGHLSEHLVREPDRWFLDPRVPESEQTGEPVYVNNDLDRGHLVRRLDPAWGPTAAVAKIANDDTFHFTNCTPQHKQFNEDQTYWAGLEDYILQSAEKVGFKVTVFTGPVLADNDDEYRGVKLPRQFWKVVVMVKAPETLSATAYLLSQESLIQGLEVATVPEDFSYGAYRTYQVPVRQVETLTRLSFGALPDLDPLSTSEAAAVAPRELTSATDLVL
jgi:DNA/RNA endonuclease G (NUC1)